ncbi:MAG: DUF6326 family protein [Bacteroidota bacterium]
MKELKIDAPSLLSTLWIYVLLNMIFRDLHQFASPGFIEDLMSLEVAEAYVLIFGIILEIPIIMVVLSRVLKAKVNKWANIIAVGIFSLSMLSTLAEADMDDIFFMIMELAGFIAIVKIAWDLSKEEQQRQKASYFPS